MSKITIQGDNVSELRDIATGLFPIIGADAGLNRAAIKVIESAIRWNDIPGEDAIYGLRHAIEVYKAEMRRSAVKAGAVPSQDPPTMDLFEGNDEDLQEEQEEQEEQDKTEKEDAA